MDVPTLTLDDVFQHVVTFGMDIYPTVEIPNDRTHLNMFYEAARAEYGGLYEALSTSDTEFRISKRFRKDLDLAGPAISLDTFVLTNRGPVFNFPLLLPDLGRTPCAESYLDAFHRVRELFFTALRDKKILRVGLVRDVLFSTGTTPALGHLTRHVSLAGADLVGGNALFEYRDTRFNHRVHLDAVEIRKATQLPVGMTVEERHGFGLRVRLDVNNSEPRPLNEADIQEVIERASSLWPGKLLEYLAGRSAA